MMTTEQMATISKTEVYDSNVIHLSNGNTITILGILRMVYLIAKKELNGNQKYQYLVTINKLFDNIEKNILLINKTTFAIEKNRRRLLAIRNRAQNLCWDTYWGLMNELFSITESYRFDKKMILAIIRETAIKLEEKEERSRDDKQLSL